MNRFSFLRRLKEPGAQSPASADVNTPTHAGRSVEEDEKEAAGRPGRRSRLSVSVRTNVGSVDTYDDVASESSTTSFEFETTVHGEREGPDGPDCARCCVLARRLAAVSGEKATAERTITELRGELFRIQAASPLGVGDKEADAMAHLASELGNAKVELANATWHMESKARVLSPVPFLHLCERRGRQGDGVTRARHASLAPSIPHKCPTRLCGVRGKRRSFSPAIPALFCGFTAGLPRGGPPDGPLSLPVYCWRGFRSQNSRCWRVRAAFPLPSCCMARAL